MRRAFLLPLLFLAVAMVACAPAVTPTAERNADGVTITVTVAKGFYDVNASILRATTDDARCVALDGDLSCALGDVLADAPASVTVQGEVGQVACTVAGFLEPSLTLPSYRSYPCK